MAIADAEHADLIAAYGFLEIEVAEQIAKVGERDATIERLWAQLNEATNRPDHNDPEFGFDKTAALSDPGEDGAREALATRLRALCEDAEDRHDWVRCADLRAMLGTS